MRSSCQGIKEEQRNRKWIFDKYSAGCVKGTPAMDKQIQRFSSVSKGLETCQRSNAIQPVKAMPNEPPLIASNEIQMLLVLILMYMSCFIYMVWEV